MASIFSKDPENLIFKNPTPGEITLVAGLPVSTSETLTADRCNQIKECGFNAVSAIIGMSYIKDSLINCGDAGLKMFLLNGTLKNPEINQDFIDRYGAYPGLGGWLLNKNIHFSTLVDIVEGKEVQDYIAYKDIIAKDKNHHPIFIGLPGDWDYDNSHHKISDYTINRSKLDYPTFIAEFQRLFQPSFWPVAYFADMKSIKGNELTTEERYAAYCRTLQYYSYLSRYTMSPFWAFCRCQAVTDYYGFVGEPVTLASLRGNVFTALAYGAQGIYYWDYKQSAGPEYSYAPIDSNGNKTRTWDMVRTVNEEVKAFNDIFYGSELIDCRHWPAKVTGSGTEASKMMRYWQYPVGPLMNITLQTSSSLGLMVSYLSKEGKNYLVIVCNALYPMTSSNSGEEEELNVRLTFSDYWTIRRLVKSGTGYIKIIITDYSSIYKFVPGSYMIFSWE